MAGDEFGRVPKGMVVEGRWARLNGAQAGVLIALAAHANTDWQAWPSIATICKCTGHDARTAQRALRELERAGLIQQVEPGGGRGRPTRYSLVTNPGTVAGVSNTTNPGADAALSGSGNPGIPAPKPRHSRPETPAFSCVNPGVGAARTDEQIRTNSNSGPAAVVCSAEQEEEQAIADVLTKLDVGEPKRGALARAWASVPRGAEKVRAAGEVLLSRELGPGAIVRQLEVALDREHLEAADRAAAERKRREQAKTAADRERCLQAVRAMPTEEVERLRAIVLGGIADAAERAKWSAIDPRANAAMAHAVCQARKVAAVA